MTSREQTAAATRRSLLLEAGLLLKEGGPGAVTLRAVGARAGLTRGAPYGHFEDKEQLLGALAAEGWDRLTRALAAIRDEVDSSADQRVRTAVRELVVMGTSEPFLYALMFVIPLNHPETVRDSAARTQDVFLDIVGDVVGPDRARSIGALLLAGAHGISGMESSGHLGGEKWQLTADQLVLLLVDRATR